MSRNGKIARLPHEVRERICRGFKTRDQMTEELGRAIFGETWDDDKKGTAQAEGTNPQKSELTKKLKALFVEWVQSAEVRERLENDGKTCAELTDEAGRAIFGESWDKDDCAPGGAKQGTAHEIPASAKATAGRHEIHEMKKTAAGTGDQGTAAEGGDG